MSIENIANPNNRVPPGPCRCFFCFQLVQTVAVLWSGDSGAIVFHPDCARDFAGRLMVDAIVAQKILAGKPIPPTIDATLKEQGRA